MHSRLVNLSLVNVVDSQALYLLRVITPTGTMSQLRSLGLQIVSSSSILEGSTWYEGSDGRISDTRKRGAMPTRHFDANYVATLSKATPNLDELELIGHSDGSIVRWVPRISSYRVS